MSEQRITDAGDVRITDSGEDRIVEGDTTLTLDTGHISVHGGALTLTDIDTAHITVHGRNLSLSGHLTTGHISCHGRDLRLPGELAKGHVTVHGRSLRNPQQHLPRGHIRCRARGLILPKPAGAAEWLLDITTRAGVAVGAFASNLTANVAPVLAFDFQDPVNDIGVGHLTVPAEHSVNDWLGEDNLIHYYARGVYVTSLIVREPDVRIVDREGKRSETATYRLETLASVLAEGIIEPPGDETTRPASADRLFDSSDPARDNSDFVGVESHGTVTDAQATYAVTPYGSGIEYPNDVEVINPPGHTWFTDTPNGKYYFFKDQVFTPGYYRSNQVADNIWEARSNGVVTLGQTVGFGSAASIGKRFFSGLVRLWAVVDNLAGPVTYAAEWVEVDAGDNPIRLACATDTSWSVMAAPPSPPGFTPGEIGLLNLAEEQAHGVWLDVVPTFTAGLDSAGRPWTSTWEVSTKAEREAEAFWLKEMTAKYCDVDFRWQAGIKWDLFIKDGRHQPTGLTLNELTNLGELEVAAAPAAASQFLAQFNDGGELGYRTVTQTPEAGHPAKRRGLALGADHTILETDIDGDGQLDIFNRQRVKPTFGHVTTRATINLEFPGVAYWKWSIINIAVTSRWITSTEAKLIAMTVHLDGNGNMQATPEAGDLIVPVAGRAGVILRRLTAPSLGGQARNTSPLNRV